MPSLRASRPPEPSLEPTGGSGYLVRWPRSDRREVRQRFYRHRSAAIACRDKLIANGFSAAIYSTPVSWTEVDA